LSAMLASSIGSGVVLMVVGMGVVFGALVVLLGIIATLGRVLRERAAEVAPAPVSDAGTAGVDEGALSGALVAVLTAAAVAATKKRVRVRRVTMVGRSGGGSAWIAGGRASLMGSHQPGPRRLLRRRIDWGCGFGTWVSFWGAGVGMKPAGVGVTPGAGARRDEATNHGGRYGVRR